MIGLLDKYQNEGTVTKANVKASGGRVVGLRVTNANIATRYVSIHNKATAPVATDVPDMYFLLPAGTATVPSVTEINSTMFSEAGRNCPLGIGWSIGTTANVFTDGGTAADHTITITYS